jgi:hypothetical protein
MHTANQEPKPKANIALLVFSWLLVVVPLGYGLWQTFLKALSLFGY